jgi:hypothetical protein
LPSFDLPPRDSDLPIAPNRRAHLVTHYETISNPSSTESFDAVLYNFLSLFPFVEFCIALRTVEHMLFWIEVEIFRCCDSRFNLVYGKHIYHTYLARNAPLRINLREEIRSDILLPVTNATTLKKSTFDEAQQEIYHMLLAYAFDKFKMTPAFLEFQEAKRSGGSRCCTRLLYHCLHNRALQIARDTTACASLATTPTTWSRFTSSSTT